MAYPGTSTEVKAYLWRTVCLPTAAYGLDALPISHADIERLESLQGTLIKQSLGLAKRMHHTKLLRPMNIAPVSETIDRMTLSLYSRIFRVDSPARDLCSYMLSKYLLTGVYHKNTLIGRVINMGISPVRAALSPVKLPRTVLPMDGTVDSLRDLIHGEQYTSLNSQQYTRTKLLCRAF